MERRNWSMLLALAVAVSVAACGGGDAADDAEPDTVDSEQPAADGMGGDQVALGPAPEGAAPQAVQQGQAIFTGKGNCFTCHGMDAQGTQLAPNLTDSEWINIEDGSWESIQGVVRDGVANPMQHPSPMPAMGGAQLSDDEIASVSAYVYAISQSGG